jgi:hypothetical protein
MSDYGQTLAQEVSGIFRELAKEPNRKMITAFADLSEADAGSVEFLTALAVVQRKCDQLVADIHASKLREGSKDLYAGAVQSLEKYISIAGLLEYKNHQLRSETQAFEYLVLVDDNLAPLEDREIDEQSVEEIVELAERMLKDLNAADMDPRLKAFLERQIKHFLWTIHSFELVGVEGLSQAWGAMTAEIHRSKGMSGAKKPEAEAWYKKALPILGAIGLVVTSASATVEQADNLLTHGQHIIGVVTGHDDDSADDKGGGKESDGKAAAKAAG